MTHLNNKTGNFWLRNSTALLAAVALTGAVSVTFWGGSGQIVPSAQAQNVSLTVC